MENFGFFLIYYSMKAGDIMKLYCFLKEYQEKNKYNNLMKKLLYGVLFHLYQWFY